MKKTLEKYQLTIKGERIPKEILKKYYGADKYQRDIIYDEVALDRAKKIGRRFTKFRKEKKWSIEELATITQIPLLVIEDLEAGNPLIAAHIHVYIARKLEVEIMQIFNRLGFGSKGRKAVVTKPS